MADYDQSHSGAGVSGIIQSRPLNIAILTHNALDSTKLCLESIAKNTSTPCNIFILDNLSSDDTPQWLAAQTQSNLFYRLSKVNTGVPGGRNVLSRMIEPYLPADGFVVFLDNDMEVLPAWDAIAMAFFADHQQAGIASAFGHRMIVHRDGRELLPAPKLTEEVDVACGGFACFIRAETLRAVGPFDEKLGLFWHEDDDYGVRAIQKGFKVYALPHLPVIHHEHKSGFDTAEKRKKEDGSHANQSYLVHKWRAMGAVDWRGRIIRHNSEAPQAESREVLPGISVHGIDRDGGGRFLVMQNAGITISAERLPLPARLDFDLRCEPRSYYNNFPFNLDLYLNGQFHSSLSFTGSNQIVKASLDLKPGGAANVELRSQAAFVPLLGNQSQTDQRAVFGYMGNLSLRALDASDRPSCPAPRSDRKLPPDPNEQGLLLIGPAFEASEGGSLFRSLVQSLPEDVPLKVHVTAIEEKPLLELRKRPEDVFAWQRRLTRELSGGTALIVLPEFAGPDPDFFLKYKQAFPQINKWIALLNPDDGNLPPWFMKACTSLDRIWLLHNATRERLLAAGIPEDHIQLLPVGIDPSLFSRDGIAAIPELQRAGYIFLSIIDWQSTQAWDVLLRAYLQSFTAQDDVCLLLKSNSLMKPVAQGLLHSYIAALGLEPGKTAEVAILDDQIDENRLPALLKTVDCLVQPNRARAPGFYQLAGMSMELPVITAAWDASDGYASEENSFVLVGGERVKACNELSAIFPEATAETFWHEPDLNELCRHLRAAYDKREESAKKGKVAREHVKRDHNRKRCIEWLLTEAGLKRTSSTPMPVEKSGPVLQISQPAASQQAGLSIGIDARTLTYPETSQRGIGHYTFNHLSTLMRLQPDWSFVYYLHERSDDQALDKLLQAPNASWRRFEDRRFADLDLFHMPDLMSIMPGYDSPFNLVPENLPVSLIMYDFIPIAMRDCHFDQWHHSRRNAYLARLTQLRRSQAMILSISEHTRQDLQKYADIDPARARSIMAGLNSAMQRETPSPAAVQQTIASLGVNAPFFMTVGGLDMHKGFATTASAYVHICNQMPMSLVVVGSEHDPYKEAFRNEFTKVGAKGVIFTGYLSRQDLQALYASATALIFPSRYEGFGLPVLEAMAHGCPVITSNTSSLPEVAGDAAILHNPEDILGVAQSMLSLLQDGNLRSSLRERGLRQAAKFTWEDVAARTIAAWEELLGRSLAPEPAQMGPQRTTAALNDMMLML